MRKAASVYSTSSSSRRSYATPATRTSFASSYALAPSYSGGFSSSSARGGSYSYGFSGQSVGHQGITPQITNVTFDQRSLQPVPIGIDQNVGVIRTQEKEQIKTLNNRFATFIDKVRFSEQQNKMSETKWSLSQEQTTSRSNLDSMFEAYISNSRRQLDGLGNEKVKSDGELKNMQGSVEDFKMKYEEEINKRAAAENDFVVLKKDVDAAYMNKVESEAKVDALQDEINFLRAVYEAELRESQGQIKDTSVVVEMDNSRQLDMDAIVAEVRAQYEDIANRSKAEAEMWYKQKYEEIASSAGQYETDSRSTKAEIAESNRMIARLQNEIEAIKAQRANIENQIKEAEDRGELAVADAKKRIKDSEDASTQAKTDMAKQVREYQDLMNIKLASDIEIATYRKSSEGEEYRLASGGSSATIHVQQSSSSSGSSSNAGFGFGGMSGGYGGSTITKSVTQQSSSKRLY